LERKLRVLLAFYFSVFRALFRPLMNVNFMT
jgi:hypothetical protein